MKSDSSSSSSARHEVSGDVLAEIRAAVESVRFGSVEIVIHDSKVVFITRTEKIKLREEVAVR